MAKAHGHSRRQALTTMALAAPAALGAVSSLLVGAAEAGQAAAPDLAVMHGADIKAATRQAVAALGGMTRFVSRGDVVFVKPNIGFPRAPAQGANTHPDVVAAVVEMCVEAGAKLVKIGDRTLDLHERCYRRSGIQAAAEQAGARVDMPDGSRFRRMNLRGEFVGEWEVWTDAVEADTLINVPVAKHHSLSRMTAGMKSWFGMLGGERERLHARIDVTIADLAQFFRPELTVLDASRVLIRNGPQGGSLADVRQMDLVAASVDPVAIEAFTATLLGLAPNDVGFIRAAQSRGLGRLDLDRMRVVRRDL